jgi:hypothetical protein
VLRKALEARLPVILVVNKVDRPDARIAEVVNAVYKLFLDLDADESQIEFPIVYCNARAGHACLDPHTLDDDLAPLLDFVVEHIPAPEHEEGPPLQALVTNLDASPYVGRLALCRIQHGTIRRAQQIAWCRADGTIERAKVTELYVTEALERVEADEAGPDEIVAVAGTQQIEIALRGRQVPILIEPGFDEVNAGDFDGAPIDSYWSWKDGHISDEHFPGGESEHDALRRYADALQRLLRRTEPVTLVVTHEHALRSIATAAAHDPSSLAPDTALVNAVPYSFDERALRRARTGLLARVPPKERPQMQPRGMSGLAA